MKKYTEEQLKETFGEVTATYQSFPFMGLVYEEDGGGEFLTMAFGSAYKNSGDYVGAKRPRRYKVHYPQNENASAYVKYQGRKIPCDEMLRSF